MPEPKTQRTGASVAAFLATIGDDARRRDARAIDTLLREVTGEKPAMWGDSIVGYGVYETQSGHWPRLGFSPRKQNLVLYIMPGFAEFGPLLERLGQHKTGRACLYISRLAHVDETVLRQLVQRSWAHMSEAYGPA